ncbi:MAG TPA: 5-oxoprolinase subunit PxpB [Gammaproteobacteria bacterium]
MRQTPVKFLPAGDTALVVQFGDRIDRELNERVLRLAASVRAAGLAGVRETVPTFRSLLVHYDPVHTRFKALCERLRELLDTEPALAARTRQWSIPVCYEPRFAPDLEEVAERTGHTPQEVISLHGSVNYHVYMVGFLPGYPYMGDLPEALALPRRENPRVRVPPGAVGIATNLTAIYSLESPGGWHLIGSTPVRIFDARWSPPALFAPGDSVQFSRISADEHDRLYADIATGRYRMKPEVTGP